MISATRRAVRGAFLLGAAPALLVVAGCGGGKDGNRTTGGRETGTPSVQVAFYDWEPNVIGDPNNPIKGLFNAVNAASKAKPKAEPIDIPPGGPDQAALRKAGVNPSDRAAVQRYYDRKNDTAGAKYYLFGPDRNLIAGPASSCGDLLGRYGSSTGPSKSSHPSKGHGGVPKDSACRDELKKLDNAGPPAGSKVKVVPRGIVVIQDDALSANGKALEDAFFVLEDDSELTAADITDPKQAFDQQTREPIVTFGFTQKGRAAFERVTKREAQRGAEIVLPPGTPKSAAFQRFGIVLDDKLKSNPTIDFTENPEGIPGDTGAQINIGTGGNALAEAQRLAAELR